MIPLINFAFGFTLSLAAYSLAGRYSFFALAAIAGYALYRMFLAESRRPTIPFILGMSLAEDSFGLARLGLASTFGLSLILLYELFGARLNFTSGFIRYMIALALAFLMLAALLFSPSGIAHRLLALAAFYPFVVLASYYAASLRQKTTYELI